MTALCGGGTSSPKPGVAANVIFDVGLINAGLGLISPWLLPFAALIDSFTYEAVSECGTDPPAMPTFTATDALNLVGGVLNPNFSTTLAKVNDALLNYAWGLLCQCDNGTVVPPPAVIGPPEGIGVGGQGSLLPCFSGSYDGDPGLKPAGSLDSVAQDITTSMLPVDTRKMTLTDLSGTYNIYGIPASVNAFSFNAVVGNFEHCAGTYNHIFGLKFYNSSGTYVSGYSFWLAGIDDGIDAATEYLSSHPGASYWRLAALNDPAIGGCGLPIGPYRLAIQTYCGAGTPGVASCCPPDPSLVNALQAVRQLVERVAYTHGSGPTSYVEGATHVGLSGAGSIVLGANTIGVRCTMTTVPTGTLVTSGDPVFYWDAGFITPIAVGSPLRGWRLVFTPQTFMLPLVADTIGYTLLHGTIIDLVELEAAAAP